ncbi:CPBP family intramembrane glutamic endopeptidase [Nocardia paucivorans]|uniref:CPBP family intramembrane glutamic endopeptidase n=1 Tax=Nocardia paucivorans TaxID=114259 RepID=UPI0005932FE4|nr:CPBP family intramembrane glutamic endopeptidase [Nocardia paucivorans]
MTTAPSDLAPPITTTAIRARGGRWFLLLAFAGAWIPWGLAGAAGYSLDDPVVQLLSGGVVAPALAAIVVRRWITREGFADSGLRPRIGRTRSSYSIAALLPLGILAIALLLAAALGWWDPLNRDFGSDDALFLAIALVVPVVAAPLFWGEEFGWTSYLRDRLLPGRPVATTFATGLIWGVWHWPLPWVGYLGSTGTVVETIVAMLLWLPLSILLEFVIGWLWVRGGSVWPAAILHSGSNLVVAAGLERFVDGPDTMATATTLLMCVAYLPVVAWIVVTTRRDGSRGSHPTTERTRR